MILELTDLAKVGRLYYKGRIKLVIVDIQQWASKFFSDVTGITRHPKAPVTRPLFQPVVLLNTKEHMKAAHYWLFVMVIYRWPMVLTHTHTAQVECASIAWCHPVIMSSWTLPPDSSSIGFHASNWPKAEPINRPVSNTQENMVAVLL